MGQKVNPKGLRLGIIRNWDSRWYAEKEYKDNLLEDFFLRKTINSWDFKTGKGLLTKNMDIIQNIRFAGLSKVEIERTVKQILIYIVTSKPGVIIGKGGNTVENLENYLRKKTGKQILVKVKEVNNPDLDATLVANSIATQLEKRISHRRAMKQAIDKALKFGAKGIKISCEGRLAGAEMARKEWYKFGKIPLQKLVADIDYATAEAITTYGKIGIKVWIYKGDINNVNAEENKV